jgi:16S rRNA processing protein RimM
VLLCIVGAPHGVRGDMRIRTFTGDPLAIGDYGPLVSEDGRRFEVLAVRPLKDDMVIARLSGVGDRTRAEALTHTKLFVPRSALPPPDEEEFYHADLIGMRAETEDGAFVGTVVAINDFGAGDIIEFERPGREPLTLTFTKAAVPIVDIPGRRMVLVLPDEIEVRGE